MEIGILRLNNFIVRGDNRKLEFELGLPSGQEEEAP